MIFLSLPRYWKKLIKWQHWPAKSILQMISLLKFFSLFFFFFFLLNFFLFTSFSVRQVFLINLLIPFFALSFFCCYNLIGSKSGRNHGLSLFQFFYFIVYPKKISMCSVHLPLPLLPTKRKSLNLATWFFITAVQLRSSPQKFSSLPARIVTMVPSITSPNAKTLNAIGSVLFERQCVGNVVQT